MADVAIWAAVVLSATWALTHLVLGGRQVARPLRDDRTLDPTVRATVWMCWHMVTVTLFTIPLFFALGALGRAGFTASGTVLAGAIAAAGVFAPLALGTTFRVLPQGLLFVPVAALGAFGLMAG